MFDFTMQVNGCWCTFYINAETQEVVRITMGTGDKIKLPVSKENHEAILSAMNWCEVHEYDRHIAYLMSDYNEAVKTAQVF